MKGLREIGEDIARMPGLPTLRLDRMLACERVAKMISEAPPRSLDPAKAEPWEKVARRLDPARLDAADPRDMRRAISDIWLDPDRSDWAAPIVDHARGAERKSFDRALVMAYLRRFPVDHRAFPRLAQAAALAAARHDWPWRARGQRWPLWDAKRGPQQVAQELLLAPDPAALLVEAGFEGDLSEGAYVAAALAAACREVGSAAPARAEEAGRQLIALFKQLGVHELNGALALALLAPWHRGDPADSYRRDLCAELTKRIGDPRLERATWSALGLPAALIERLQRWLTEKSMREFFRVVGRTVDRQDQWAAREAFWLGYLDAGVVSDAWFALGRDARAEVRRLGVDTSAAHGVIDSDSASVHPSHSSLVMTIGDLRIAEWSHNGACRFWRASDERAPKLYERRYSGRSLKAMAGGPGFLSLPHNPSPGWERKFAAKIYGDTRVRHPKWGTGL